MSISESGFVLFQSGEGNLYQNQIKSQDLSAVLTEIGF